jgi:shikimate dehydrogenase
MDQRTFNPPATASALDSTARFLTGLVGEQIAASRSPWLHEREADAQGVRLIYSLYDLAGAGGANALPKLLEAAKRMGFAGLNVTHPYKQRVMPFLDEVSGEARRIGAVNTIAIRGGRTIGYNTDYLGFAEGLKRGLGGARFANVLQLGAGGAGAATANALLEHGTGLLHIYDVDQSRAKTLIESLASNFGSERVELAPDIATALEAANGIVNATPVGMVGHPGSPLPPDTVRPSQWVADIVYFPLETELLRHARAMGCRTLDGVRMVVFQAAAAFDIFTGLTADRERMLAGALEHWTS